MTTIAIANRKGGTGKTTTALNLAIALADGHQVLLVELDPSSPYTEYFPMSTPGPPLLDLLCEEGTLHEALQPTPIANLTLLPADRSLVMAESDLALMPDPEQRLRLALGALHGRFEYIVIDAPSNDGMLATCALVAADAVIVPTPVHVTAAATLRGQMQALERIRLEFNPQLQFEGIVPVMWIAGSHQAKAVLNEIRQKFGENILLPPIRLDSTLSESAMPQLDSVFASVGLRDYRTLAALLTRRTHPQRWPGDQAQIK